MGIPPPRRPIDLDEAQRLREKEGLSAAEIARRMGFTAPSMRRALRRAGIDLRPKRPVSEARWGWRLHSIWSSVRQRCNNTGHALYERLHAMAGW